jgi:ribosome-binding protein aMBF1 (putative translation factor)
MEKGVFNKKFGSFLKQKRLEKGWSQADLAAKIGHNFQNVSRLERGEISPTFYWCSEILAPALEITLGELTEQFTLFCETEK